MKNMKKKIGLLVLGTIVMTLSAIPAFAGYDQGDVDSAGSDTTQLKAIADDTGTPERVRYNALVKLPQNVQKQYLEEEQWVKSDDTISALLSFRIGQYGLLAADDYGQYIPLQIKHSVNGKSVGYFQQYYVAQLIKEGEYDTALTESKRLWGLASIDKNQVNKVLNLIANAIMKKELDNGATIVQAARTSNDYKQAISDGTEQSTAYWQLPYPPANAEVTNLESDNSLVVALQAKIYNGKWVDANSKAEALLMEATTKIQVEDAMEFVGKVANGRAGTPTAANSIFQEQEEE